MLLLLLACAAPPAPDPDPTDPATSVAPDLAVGIGSVGIAPAAPGTDDQLEAVLAPGVETEVAYAWMVGGRTCSHERTVDPQFYARGEEVILGVTGADGSSAWARILIGNTPPVPVVAIVEGEDGSLQCVATATDADDDPLTWTYTWTDGWTGATLPPERAAEGTDWTCIATVDDGFGPVETSASLHIPNADEAE